MPSPRNTQTPPKKSDGSGCFQVIGSRSIRERKSSGDIMFQIVSLRLSSNQNCRLRESSKTPRLIACDIALPRNCLRMAPIFVPAAIRQWLSDSSGHALRPFQGRTLASFESPGALRDPGLIAAIPAGLNQPIVEHQRCQRHWSMHISKAEGMRPLAGG